MWESRRYFQRVWEGWKAGFMAFHAFHTLSFPWPAFCGAAIMHPCEVRSPTPARSGLAPLGGDLRCQLEPKRATFRKQKDESNCWLIGDAPRGLAPRNNPCDRASLPNNKSQE